MSNLKSLTFVQAPPANSSSPAIYRRQRLIERLEEQRLLAKGPAFNPISKRWKKAADGTKSLVNHQRRLKPWWKADDKGFVVLTVRSGFNAFEFEKGKAAITVGALDRLDGVFGTLIAATKAGELDAALEAAAGTKKASRAA